VARTSAGLLAWRRADDGGLQVLLGHMGGPLWAKKDEHAWSIPKGEHPPEEEPLAAARREWTEELGLPAPEGELIDLGAIKQSGGKTVRAWAVAADVDPAAVVPGTFTMEWPPRSGRTAEFPEMDRFAWLDLDVAAGKLVKAQAALLERLREALQD